MAALDRPVFATYEVHESIRVDTTDNEDHTFCGIMFPIEAKSTLPVERILINSVAVRGELGSMTVWVTEDVTRDENGWFGLYELPVQETYWSKIYEKNHNPSRKSYQTLDLSQNPIEIVPGEACGIYVHSTLESDRAIVYDNSMRSAPRHQPRYQDSMLAIHSGYSHVSITPFGRTPTFWSGRSAWRTHREFVGQIEYGCVYKLWRPEIFFEFGSQFQNAVRTVFLCQRRYDSPVSMLPDDCLFYVFNMCRHDWFETEAENADDADKQSSGFGGGWRSIFPFRTQREK